MNKAFHFIIYIIARLIKSVLFWTPISKFNRWYAKPEYIQRDINLLFFTGFNALVYFLGGIYAVVVSVLLILIIWFIFVILIDSQDRKFRK